MSFRNDLKNKDFVITVELNPPKGTGCKTALDNAMKIKGLVSAINVTDNSGANVKMCPLALSTVIQNQTAIETIWQMTCRDRNRLALQSDLLGGIALGLKNILPLKGDDPKQGDHPETSQNFDLQTEELLKAISNLKQGTDLNGNKVDIESADFDYCVGSAAHPGMPDLKVQRETMERRVGLGVEFFQTQICFELEQIEKFADSIGPELAKKTLVGITPLKTLGQAKFIDKNIWGVSIPASSMQVMESALGGLDPKSEPAKQKQQTAGLGLSRKLVDKIRELPFKGIHLMAIGQENVLDEIIKSIVPEFIPQ